MTPSDTREQHDPSSSAPSEDPAALIAACARDERPALKTLYERTAPDLYARAIAATSKRADADQALVQTYLAVFAEAEQFDYKATRPKDWLQGILGRHLPVGDAKRRPSDAPVEPPAELWQKLDIALGLQRLDRHIKPGIATQARGRDPMPNAHDRRIERQLRFWRVTSAVSFSAFVLAAAFIGAVGLQGGSLNPLGSSAVGSAEVPAAGAAAAPVRPPIPRLAILSAAEDGRVWRVDVAGDGLRVRPLPPVTGAGSGRPGVLALWARLDPALHAALKPQPAAGGEVAPDAGAVSEAAPTMLRLADLDPAGTTGIQLPDGLTTADLDAADIELVISLEPLGAEAASEPMGPVLFSGRLEP